MQKLYKHFMAAAACLLLTVPVLAQATALINPDVLDENRNQAGLFTSYVFDQSTDENTLSQYVAQVLAVFFGLLATIFIVLIVYAGYNWLTAAGDPAKVSKAQTIIRTAIIGLVILVTAYAITYWIFAHLPDNQVNF